MTCVEILNSSKVCKSSLCDKRCGECELEGKCNLCPYYGCPKYPTTEEVENKKVEVVSK